MSPQARFADAAPDVENENEKTETSQLETIPTGTGSEPDGKSSKYADSTAGLDHKAGVARAERKLLFKMDMVSLALVGISIPC